MVFGCYGVFHNRNTDEVWCPFLRALSSAVRRLNFYSYLIHGWGAVITTKYSYAQPIQRTEIIWTPEGCPLKHLETALFFVMLVTISPFLP